MFKLDEKISENLKRYREKVEEVRSDRDLSEEAKRRYLDEAYQQARRRYEELAAERRQEVRQRVERTRAEAFKVPTLLGADKANLLSSYRDALYRADGEMDPKRLSLMLDRAHETGDTIMAKAILRRGYELKSEHLVSSYLERFPSERDKWDEFVDAATESNDVEAYGVPGQPERPLELERPNAYTRGGGTMGGSDEDGGGG
jgi:hypothetical protein